MCKKMRALVFAAMFFISSLCPAAWVFASSISDTASSWEEFASWLAVHQKSGGALMLTEDILCQQKSWSYIRPRNAEPLTVELGEHSLTFTEAADLRAFNLSVHGKGGADASIRAAAGAYVVYEIYGESRLNGDTGPVLWQEEGAVLYADKSLGSAVHFAKEPVAESIEKVKTISVAPGEDGISLLPDTVQAYVCEQGKKEKMTLPVRWTIDSKAQEDFHNRCRITVFGNLEIPSLQRPQCTAVFKDQPLTWTDINVRVSSGLRYDIIADFEAAAAYPLNAQAQYSFDSRTYEPAGQISVETEKEQSFTLTFYEPEYFLYIGLKDGDLIWNTGLDSDLYLRIKWLSAPEENKQYSDVIKISGDDFSVIPFTDGNRGGGTGIIERPGVFEQEGEEDSSDAIGETTENKNPQSESDAKAADRAAAAVNGGTVQNPIQEEPQQSARLPQDVQESGQGDASRKEGGLLSRPGPKGTISVVVGLGAVAAVMAAAFFCLNPGVLKKMASHFNKRKADK